MKWATELRKGKGKKESKKKTNKKNKKNALYLSVNVFSKEVLIGTLFLHLLLKTGPPFYRVIQAMQGNGSTFISQLF